MQVDALLLSQAAEAPVPHSSLLRILTHAGAARIRHPKLHATAVPTAIAQCAAWPRITPSELPHAVQAATAVAPITCQSVQEHSLLVHVAAHLLSPDPPELGAAAVDGSIRDRSHYKQGASLARGDAANMLAAILSFPLARSAAPVAERATEPVDTCAALHAAVASLLAIVGQDVSAAVASAAAASSQMEHSAAEQPETQDAMTGLAVDGIAQSAADGAHALAQLQHLGLLLHAVLETVQDLPDGCIDSEAHILEPAMDLALRCARFERIEHHVGAQGTAPAASANNRPKRVHHAGFARPEHAAASDSAGVSRRDAVLAQQVAAALRHADSSHGYRVTHAVPADLDHRDAAPVTILLQQSGHRLVHTLGGESKANAADAVDTPASSRASASEPSSYEQQPDSKAVTHAQRVALLFAERGAHITHGSAPGPTPALHLLALLLRSVDSPARGAATVAVDAASWRAMTPPQRRAFMQATLDDVHNAPRPAPQVCSSALLVCES